MIEAFGKLFREAMDEKDKRIQELEAENQALKATILQLQSTILQLQERIADLERRLGLNSSNSNKPPSSDGLQKKRRDLSLRKRGENPSGGQFGHKGSTLSQVENPDHIVRHPILCCEKCHQSLDETPVARLVKRQVHDLPPITALEITEHQSEVKTCSCGHVNIAPFPEGVTAPVQYGKCIRSVAIYLSGFQLIPEDRLQELFADLFGLFLATSTLAQFNESFAKKIASDQEGVLQKLKEAAVKHLDETGFRIAGKTYWLHVICNELLTYYRVSEKRGDVLEGGSGIVVHDHWKPYFTMSDVLHSLCNAHHLRELKAVGEMDEESWALKMFSLLVLSSRLKNPPVERIQALYDRILEEGLRYHTSLPPLNGRKRRQGHNLLLRLKNFKDETLRFLTVPEVPFTNNVAEQAVRMMKTKQKISGSFRTLSGAEIFCRIRGFISTARKQGQNPLQAIQQVFA